MISYPLDVGGTLTRVLEAGAGDKHVLLIPGIGARGDRWRRNIDVIAAEGYHVYAFDLPGHGFAAKGEAFDYSARGFADFAASLTNELGLERVALVGTSLGGQIAGLVACREPTRVSALVLVGSLGFAPLDQERRTLISGRLVDTTRDGIEQKLRASLGRQELISEPWIEEETRINNSPGAAEAFAAMAAYVASGAGDDGILEGLARLEGLPILIAWGADDQVVPVTVGQAAAGHLTGSRFELIQHAGHLPYYEEPVEFNTLLLRFLADGVGPGREGT
jgi:pimeloyl-ACP methyl ester carboxylesterase